MQVTDVILNVFNEIQLCTPDSLSIAASVLKHYNIELSTLSQLQELYKMTPKSEYNKKFSVDLENLKCKAIEELSSVQSILHDNQRFYTVRE